MAKLMQTKTLPTMATAIKTATAEALRIPPVVNSVISGVAVVELLLYIELVVGVDAIVVALFVWKVRGEEVSESFRFNSWQGALELRFRIN